ncbi:MAG: ABC transporter ATP-binding protein [Desertimonas sp.]
MSGSTTSRGRALFDLLRPDAWRWAGLGALVAAATALALGGPLVLRQLIDDAAAGATTREIVGWALVFLALAVVAQLIQVVVARVATTAAWTTTNGLRLRTTRHVLALDHEFHRTHTPGELIQRVDGDVTSVSDFLGQVVPKGAGALMLVGGIVGVLAVLDWPLALGMIGFLLISTWIVVALRHRAIDESEQELSALARLYGGIEERLNAAEDLRSNGASTHVMRRFVEDSTGALGAAVARERAFLTMWWGVQGSFIVGSALALAVSATLVSSGAITLGTAFLLFQYARLIAEPLEEIVHQLETVQKANGGMRRVVDLLAERPTILDRGRVSPPAGPLGIEMRGVSFDYGDDQTILHDVDLTIGAGRSVGVVGRTGSGKTTWSRLLLRLVDATDGVVSLGGVPIEEIPIAELRRRVALVPQEVELFEGTIRDNVTMFDPAPCDDAVRAALDGVGLGPLAAGDLHRSLGAGGAGLSAGEAQLIALARVWLRNPDLLVLDEATARVDPVTERRLERAVGELMRGRTTVVIAHRLSTLRRVDEIVVFDHGRVVEHDDRAILVRSDASRFRQLLELALEDDDHAVST